MTLTNNIFYLGLLPVLFLQAVGSTLYFVIFDNAGNAGGIYVLTKILLLISPLVICQLGLCLIKPRMTSSIRESLFLGIVIGAFIFATIILSAWLCQDLLTVSSPKILEKINAFHLTNFFLPFAIFFSLAHSLLEEYFWRWFVFRGLQTKLPIPHAIIADSLFFGSHHFIVLSQLFPLFLALVFTLAVIFGGIIFACSIKKPVDS